MSPGCFPAAAGQARRLTVGLLLAGIIAVIIFNYNSAGDNSASALLQRWSSNHSIPQKSTIDTQKPNAISSVSKVSKVSFKNSHSGLVDDTSIADDLKVTTRVLIWVMTYEKNLHKKAVHVKNTWARRADRVLYVSSDNDTEFPAVGFNIPEGMKHLTQKTHHAFRYIYENHLDDAEWFMKADDDTYVVVENLRYFLADKDSTEPVYFGQRMKNQKFGIFTSGGAGYVLSKEAVRRMATEGRDPKVCRQGGPIEDVALAQCLRRLGVKLKNTTDEDGRGTFFAVTPENLLLGKLPKWYMHVGHVGGIDQISHYPISFHKISPKMMHTLDLLLYHARPYGIQFGHKDYNGGKSVKT